MYLDYKGSGPPVMLDHKLPEAVKRLIKCSVGRYAAGAPGFVSHLQSLVSITALKSSFLCVC